MKITSRKKMGGHRVSHKSISHKSASAPKVNSASVNGMTMSFEMSGRIFHMDLSLEEAGALIGSLAWGMQVTLDYMDELIKAKK